MGRLCLLLLFTSREYANGHMYLKKSITNRLSDSQWCIYLPFSWKCVEELKVWGRLEHAELKGSWVESFKLEIVGSSFQLSRDRLSFLKIILYPFLQFHPVSLSFHPPWNSEWGERCHHIMTRYLNVNFSRTTGGRWHASNHFIPLEIK